MTKQRALSRGKAIASHCIHPPRVQGVQAAKNIGLTGIETGTHVEGGGAQLNPFLCHLAHTRT